MSHQDACSAGHEHGREVAQQEIFRLGNFPLSSEVVQKISESMSAYGITHVAGLVEAGLPSAFAEIWRMGFHAGIAERLKQHGVQVAELRSLFELYPRAASQH